eukprot:1801967-Rhodomonas_salina.3
MLSSQRQKRSIATLFHHATAHAGHTRTQDPRPSIGCFDPCSVSGCFSGCRTDLTAASLSVSMSVS